MTNHPGYSPPPPQQPGYRPAPNQPVPPAYAQGHQQPYTQPFDWRYQQQPQYRPQYGGTGPGPIPTATGTGPVPTATGSGPIPPGTGPVPLHGPTGTGPVPMPGMYPPMGPPPGVVHQRRPRAGMLAIGALTIAVVSAGIGGAAATLVELNHSPGGITGGTVGAPTVPAANMPPGSVEQVAAKVVPSVVMLETDLGRQSEEGSGVVLSADGLILTNNHVIAAAAKPPPGAPPPKTTVTFSDGRTTTFTCLLYTSDAADE